MLLVLERVAATVPHLEAVGYAWRFRTGEIILLAQWK